MENRNGYKLIGRLALGFILLSTSLLQAVEAKPEYQPTRDISAQWITSPEITVPAIPNLWFVWRKSISLESLPNRAICRIGCDSKYWLYINGENVVYEGGLKRGPTPNDSYFDTVDLRPFLKKGKNTIAILSWFFGRHGFSHVNSGKPGLIVDATTNGPNGLFLSSDSSWKVSLYSAIPRGFQAKNIAERNRHFAIPKFDASKVDPQWRTQTKGAFELITNDPQPAFQLPESNVRFNAAYDFNNDWKAENFNDSDWPNATSCGSPKNGPVAPWGELYDRLIPLFKKGELANYLNQSTIPDVSTGAAIVCNLPWNLQAAPYLKIDAKAGQTIVIKTNHYLQSQYRFEYITKEGIQEFEFPTWLSGENMIYEIPKGVKILSLKYRPSSYDTELVGRFACDDHFYERYWTKAVRTLQVAIRDTFMDCPDRERAQWNGDVCSSFGQSVYLLNSKIDPIMKKFIYNQAWFHRPDHVMYAPIPDGNWLMELPLGTLSTLGAYGVGLYELRTGDLHPGNDTYPMMKNYLTLWKFDNDGLVVHRAGDWDYTDWGGHSEKRILTNCWYTMAVRQMLTIAQRLHRESDVLLWQKQLASLEKNFNRIFWTPKGYHDPGNQDPKVDDRSNALAVLAGFAQPEMYPNIEKILAENFHCSPWLERFVYEALGSMGYADTALVRMKKRYTTMVDHPQHSTLWEFFDNDKASTNHPYCGGGVVLLAKYVVGLTPTSPRFETFQIVPQMGSLKEVQLRTPTEFGPIETNLSRAENHFVAKIVAPQGTSGVLAVPIEYEVPPSLRMDRAQPYRNKTYFFIAIQPGENRFEFERRK